jgi:hypothetical protein
MWVHPNLTCAVHVYKHISVATFLFLQELHHYKGHYGILLASLPGERLLYEVEKSDKYQLNVYRLPVHKRLFSRIPAGEWWGYGLTSLSTCAHPTADWIAVLEGRNNTLDIYSKCGKWIRFHCKNSILAIIFVFTLRYMVIIWHMFIPFNGLTSDNI